MRANEGKERVSEMDRDDVHNVNIYKHFSSLEFFNHAHIIVIFLTRNKSMIEEQRWKQKVK